MRHAYERTEDKDKLPSRRAKKPAASTPQADTTAPSPELLRRAVDQPSRETLTPDAVLALQRTYGNHYVQRLIARSQQTSAAPSVQRYFLHTPGMGEAAAASFPAQQKRGGTNTFLDLTNTAPNIQLPAGGGGGGGGAVVPQLRVSDDGNLAIEATDLSNRQSKVFFATPGVVADSNARLTEIASPYRLHVEAANDVTINAPLHAPVINHQLDRVVPEDVAGAGGRGTGMSLNNDFCNEVAEHVTQAGTLGGIARIQGADRELPNNDPEHRFAQYIIDRRNGDDHATAIGKLNNPVGNRATISQTYAEITEPALKTGEEMEAELANLGANYWQPTDAALGNYLGGRNGGQTHAVAAGAHLGGLGLNPGQTAIVEQSYNSLKGTEIATAIDVATGATVLNPNPVNGAVPPRPNVDALKRYVARRLEHGASHAQACTFCQMSGSPAFNAVDQAVYTGAVDVAYGVALGAVPAFNATNIRNQLKVKSPELNLARKIEAYVSARHAGQTHLAAVGLLGGAGLALNVTNNIDAAYNNVVAAYPQTPAQQATDLAQSLQDLGVNQFSAPEIGQIFGSGMTGVPGPDGKLFDYKSGRFLNASSEGWSSHYGTVVAISGSDRITLENYARVAENAGPQPGRVMQYYFQMYGTGAGQSWHEAWTSAGRPAMNAVTATYGDNKKTVWKRQLDNIPAQVAGVNIPNYVTALGTRKGNIDTAATTPLAKVAYYTGLDALITASIAGHRARANAIGAKPTLVPAALNAVNAVNDAAAVAPQIDAWVVAYQGELAGKWAINLIGKAKLRKKITRLQALAAKIRELAAYHAARHV